MHAPITEAADSEDKQQEEEDSMEGTYTVSAAGSQIRIAHVTYLGTQACNQPPYMCCSLQWELKDVTTHKDAKRFSPTFTIGGYPWYVNCMLLVLAL